MPSWDYKMFLFLQQFLDMLGIVEGSVEVEDDFGNYPQLPSNLAS